MALLDSALAKAAKVVPRPMIQRIAYRYVVGETLAEALSKVSELNAMGCSATVDLLRLVGETGGKDFIVAHPSADADAMVTAIGHGSFEYQGQRCSASAQVFLPESLWPAMRDQLAD